jgi:putative SOS response-associated peptidase YedK
MRQRSALQWFEPEVDIDELLKQSKNQFNLTDLSVLKVSKKVNDPTNNSPDLIQPIPK